MQTLYTDEYCRHLFEAFDQGCCTIEILFDDAGVPSDYRFLEVNAAFERQTGLDQVVGRRMRELASSHEEHWFQIYGQVALTGVPVRFEREARALNGSVRRLRVSCRRRRVPPGRGALRATSPGGSSRSWRSAPARDVAEAANRAKDEFLAMLGHELRNPLAPMLTALQLMRLKGQHSREQDVSSGKCSTCLEWSTTSSTSFSDTRGTIELKRRPVELFEVVLTQWSWRGRSLNSATPGVTRQSLQQGAVIDVDRARMSQAVTNLLSNAVKYGSQASGICRFEEIADGDVVRLSVKDEGIGRAAYAGSRLRAIRPGTAAA